MKTAIITTLTVFGIAFVVSMGVAAMMKFLFLTIRWINSPKKG